MYLYIVCVCTCTCKCVCVCVCVCMKDSKVGSSMCPNLDKKAMTNNFDVYFLSEAASHCVLWLQESGVVKSKTKKKKVKTVASSVTTGFTFPDRHFESSATAAEDTKKPR